MSLKLASAWPRLTGAFAMKPSISRPSARGAREQLRPTWDAVARRRCEYWYMSLRLTDIWRYPVKSMRGERLAEALVEPWGLAGDRRWMVVDAAGDPVTAREHPDLLLVTPRLDGGSIRLTA